MEEAVAGAEPVPGEAVYVLLLGDAVQYVGRSGNPLARIGTHRRAGKIAFDRYHIHECDDAVKLEEILIRETDPPCNVAHKPKPRRDDAGWAPMPDLGLSKLSGKVTVRHAQDRVCILSAIARRHGDEYLHAAICAALDALIERHFPGATEAA